jgi:hypothetical protein
MSKGWPRLVSVSLKTTDPREHSHRECLEVEAAEDVEVE